MNVLKRPRAVAETLLVWSAARMIPWLPRRAVLGLATALGRLGWWVSRRDRRVTLANLDVAFGSTRSTAEKTAIGKQAFRAFALVLLDLFWFRRQAGPRLRRWVRFDPSFDAYFERKAMIVATGHVGNWEVLAQAAAERGRPPLSVAMPLANPAVDRMLITLRERTGQRIVPREGAVRELFRALEGGGAVGIVADQNTLPEEGGCFVPLFGLPVPMTKIVGALALKTEATVLCAACVEEPGGGYMVKAERVECSGLDAAAITAAVAQAIENVIRVHTGQWLWMYKRWKFIPPDAPAGRYPFYARRMSA